MPPLELLVSSAYALPEILVFRALPFCACVLLSRGFQPLTRLACALAYGACVLAAARTRSTYFREFGLLATSMAYYALAATALPFAAAYVRSGALERGALFVLCGLLFILFPTFLHPAFAHSPAQVLGWEFALSAYSFVVERARKPAANGVYDSLFFVLVDPTLVYPERSHELSGPSQLREGLTRVLLGVACMLLAISSYQYIASTREQWRHVGYLASMRDGMLLFVSIYAAHSGRASLAIGMMRMLGYQTPERYAYPWLARTPADFWRRWNTYVGGWFRRYLFVGLAKRWARHAGRHRLLVQALSLVLTFAAIGLLHDLDFYIGQDVVSIHASLGFVVFALLALAGIGLDRRTSRGTSTGSRTMVRAVGAVAMAHLFALGATLFTG